MIAPVVALFKRSRAVRDLIESELQGATAAELVSRIGERWSCREILIHLGNCDEAAANWLRHLLRGELPREAAAMLPPDQWNAQEQARYTHLDVAGAVDYFNQAREELTEVAAKVTEADLLHASRILPTLQMTPGHEAVHLHQIREAIALARQEPVAAMLHGMAYAREQLVETVEGLCAEPGALQWRLDGGGWNGRETLLHLAVWDRFASGLFAAAAEDASLPPIPFGKGELDRWNEEQVERLCWLSDAAVLHELGAARGALIEQISRLTPDQLSREGVREWQTYREHDQHHRKALRRLLAGWRKARAADRA